MTKRTRWSARSLVILDRYHHLGAELLMEKLPSHNKRAIENQLQRRWPSRWCPWGERKGERDDVNAWPADTDFRLCR